MYTWVKLIIASRLFWYAPAELRFRVRTSGVNHKYAAPQRRAATTRPIADEHKPVGHGRLRRLSTTPPPATPSPTFAYCFFDRYNETIGPVSCPVGRQHPNGRRKLVQVVFWKNARLPDDNYVFLQMLRLIMTDRYRNGLINEFNFN